MVKPAWLGLHLPLLGEERPFDRPQKEERQNDQEWDRNEDMHPYRRLVSRLDAKN